MWSLYVVLLIPVIAGAFLWIHSRRITYGEWMRGSLLGLVTIVAFHAWTVWSLTVDYETVSGRAIRVTHCPECTVRSGDETQEMPEHWTVTIDFATELQTFVIARDEFDSLRTRFGGARREVPPSTFEPLDADYLVGVYDNERGDLVPAHSFRLSERRAESGPSLLSFAKPPAGLALHDYPNGMSSLELKVFVAGTEAVKWASSREIVEDLQAFNWRASQRLLGRARDDFSVAAWDALNAELYPEVGVNLIAIGFDDESSIAHWQEARWSGGKRNDLVLCYGPIGQDGAPAWTYCFGWSEDELVRRNLESLLLSAPPGDALLAPLKEEVLANYRPRTWPAIAYLAVPVPPGAFRTLCLIMLVLQGGYWTIAFMNRTRRSAADAAEHAEVEQEHDRAAAATRDRDDLRRVRAELAEIDPEDVDALTAVLLRDPDRAYVACIALLRLDDPRARTGLVLALTSPSFRVRELAGRSLDETTPDPATSVEAAAAIPALIDRLSHDQKTVRDEARRLLDAIEPKWPVRPDAQAMRERLLTELDRAVAEGVSQDRARSDALSAQGDAVVDALLLRAEGAAPAMVRAVLPILGGTGAPRTVAVLRERLSDPDHSDPDQSVRLAAFDGLSRFGPGLRAHPAAGELWTALAAMWDEEQDAATAARSGAVRVMVRLMSLLGDPRAVPLLLPLISNSEWAIRKEAIRALGAIGDDAAIDRLIQLASNSEGTTRIAAVTALGATGRGRIIAPLVRLFEENQNGGSLLPETLLQALFPLGGSELESLLTRAADDPHGPVSELARLRLNQLRAGFRPPGWDLTATAGTNRLGIDASGR